MESLIQYRQQVMLNRACQDLGPIHSVAEQYANSIFILGAIRVRRAEHQLQLWTHLEFRLVLDPLRHRRHSLNNSSLWCGKLSYLLKILGYNRQTIGCALWKSSWRR